MAAENTTRPRSCKRTKASRQAGIVGREAGAGDRHQAPPGRRASAEATWRQAASSAIAAFDIRHCENGGFISTLGGDGGGSR